MNTYYNRHWPVEFDQKKMVKASRMPLGYSGRGHTKASENAAEQPSPYSDQSIPKRSSSKAAKDTETDGDAADSAEKSGQIQSARKRPSLGTSTKPNAIKQRAGLLGAQAKADKRKAEGLPEPLP